MKRNFGIQLRDNLFAFLMHYTQRILSLVCLTVAIFSLIACNAAIADPSTVVSVKETPVLDLLETRCEELSRDSEYEYLPLSGKVLQAEKIYSQRDCLGANCPHPNDEWALFFAYIENSNGERFRVKTLTETRGTLKPKQDYMEKGKTYSFCARQVEVRGNPDHKDEVYQVDNIETIHQFEVPSLDQHCKYLSQESDHDYVMLSGEVIRARKEYSSGDCRAHNCYDDKPAVFWALLKSLSDDSPGKQFRVYTGRETFKSLHPKPLYMEEGRKYSFCAREFENSDQPNHGFDVYLIDFTNTIQQQE